MSDYCISIKHKGKLTVTAASGRSAIIVNNEQLHFKVGSKIYLGCVVKDVIYTLQHQKRITNRYTPFKINRQCVDHCACMNIHYNQAA